jgi:hypothetical protein
MLERSSCIARQLLFIMYFLNPIHVLVILTAGIVVPFMVNASDDIFTILGVSHYALTVFCLVLMLASLICVRNIANVMEAAIKQPRTAVRSTLRLEAALIFLNAFKRMLLLVPLLVACSTLMAIPFFTRKSSYWLPITWSSAILANISFIQAILQSMDLRGQVTKSDDTPDTHAKQEAQDELLRIMHAPTMSMPKTQYDSAFATNFEA